LQISKPPNDANVELEQEQVNLRAQAEALNQKLKSIQDELQIAAQSEIERQKTVSINQAGLLKSRYAG
jgi:hypothetical protein